ncbi:uncharacterized protein [Panulirus ornatus]|uniref:uncharacterized protein n=1 Tax=Panulirus ornatus TaxID=150431 RepID=UPI003A86544C
MLKFVMERTWAVSSNLMMVMMLPATCHNSHAGYNNHDINFGRFFKAATQTSKRLLKEVFLMMLYRSHVSSAKHSMTVAEYCFNILSWSNRKYRNSFNAEERALLEKPVTSTDFDVSLLTKMIHKLFTDMHLPESFLRALRDLKNVRNRVCHEHLVLDHAQLRDSFDDLKLTFQNILKGAADFFSADTDNLLNVFHHEVEEILASPVTAEASQYFEKVEEFRRYLVGKFITYGRQELMTHYSKLKILNPFPWLSGERFQEMLVDKIFTPLHIIEQSRNIEVFSLLTTEDKGVLPSVLVLSGIAGCGKTSLCRYFLHDWRTSSGGIATLRSVDILIHIEVRSVTCSSLVSYLQKTLLLETCRHFEEKDIIKTLQEMNVLYIIDGMDEAMSDSLQLVHEVLSVLGTSRAIITTRPECTSTITQASERYHLTSLELSIQGFSDEAMLTFTSLVFRALEPNEEQRRQQKREFLSFLKNAFLGLGDFLKLPLTLVLFISLWKEDRSRLSHVTSVTRLYFEIFSMCTMKLISRLQAHTSLHHLDLETSVEEWLLSLGEQAYSMLENGEYVINDKRRKLLMSLCAARQLDGIQVLSAFLTCEVKENFRGNQYFFSFIHKSQMDYLAAMFLSHKLTVEFQSLRQIPVLDTVLKARRKKLLAIGPLLITPFSTEMNKWDNIVKFIIGHLCTNNSSELVILEVMEKLLATHSHNYQISSVWLLVQESGFHPLVCDKVDSLVKEEYIWQVTNEHLCDPSHPTVLLLQHTNFMPKEVIIKLDTCHEVTVLAQRGYFKRKRRSVNLVPILACLSRRPSVKVYLRIQEHYYSWGSPATTDDLLTTLLPTGNLTSFMGHLGVAGVAALASVREVREAYIRVSDPAALHVLSDSLSAAGGKIISLNLRLDIPSSVSPSSLPKFSHSPKLHVTMMEVDDEHAIWAGEVLAQMSHSYVEVDLVASSLTPPEERGF